MVADFARKNSGAQGHLQAAGLLNEMENWFWEFGCKREGGHAISTLWLEQLHQLGDLAASICEGKSHDRAGVAVWGPSASGKSTLISQSVDAGAIDGRGGRLDWGVPALFSSREEMPSNILVLNPYNAGSDASGCVSRFVGKLPEEIEIAAFPVEIQLLDRKQILHAVCAGYQSECRGPQTWTVQRLEAYLDLVSAGLSADIDREAFQLLHETIDVVGMLVEARDPRFIELNASGRWPTLANRIFGTKGLATSWQAAIDCAAMLLWDGHASLTALFEGLLAFRRRLPNGRMFCNLPVAAILVDFASAANLAVSDNVEVLERRRAIIRSLAVRTEGDHQVLDEGHGSRLVTKAVDFCFLQGLVRELVIPIRIESQGTKDQQSFEKFLANGEIIDFPGIPNSPKSVDEKLIDPRQVPLKDHDVTLILARGRVASLVLGYSRTLSIDSFLILNRTLRYPLDPERLTRALEAWWRFFDPTFRLADRTTRPPLPLFVNFSFFNVLANQFAGNLLGNGLGGFEDEIKKLGMLVENDVATIIATCYPHFEEGRCTPAALARIKELIEFIRRDRSVGGRFEAPTTLESLTHFGDADGGVGFLFDQLCGNVSVKQRQQLLGRRFDELIRNAKRLIDQHCPRAVDKQCKEDVAQVKEAILRKLDEGWSLDGDGDADQIDPATFVSHRLRRLMHVDPTEFSPIPASLTTSSARKFVDEQISKWIQSKVSESALRELGIDDPAICMRMLEYLASGLNRNVIAQWLLEKIPQGSSRPDSADDRAELRRLFSIKLATGLRRINNLALSHRSFEGDDSVSAKMQRWAQMEAGDQSTVVAESPHYVAVIEPFIALLDKIAGQSQDARKAQCGDDEAVRLSGQLGAMLRN
jgi:hypothetical protein